MYYFVYGEKNESRFENIEFCNRYFYAEQYIYISVNIITKFFFFSKKLGKFMLICYRGLQL